MEDLVRKRINVVFKYYNTNPTQFSEKNSALQKRLSRQLNGGASLTFETISSILVKYNDVSSEWLLRGEGEMLKGEALTSAPVFSETYAALRAENIEKENKLLRLHIKSLMLDLERNRDNLNILIGKLEAI